MNPLKFHSRNYLYLALFIFFFNYNSLSLSAQNFTWWEQIHGYDGHSHWSDYMTFSPAFMGPNALPVPEVRTGRVGSFLEGTIAADHYFNTGDKTTGIFTSLYIPVVKNVIAIEFYG